MNARSRLGRGLSNLIPEAPPPDPSAPTAASAAVPQIDIDRIRVNPSQPRRHFSPEQLESLAASITAEGVLTPILVRAGEGGMFELIAGERRWRAASLANLPSIPAFVREANDLERLVWALAENLQRDDLSPMETADAVAQLEGEGLSHEAIATRLGLKRPTVTNLLRLRKLERPIREALDDKRLTAGHGRALLTVDSPAHRAELAKRIAAKGLSVREAERQARALNQGKKTAKPKENPALRPVRERIEHALGTRVEIRSSKGGTGSIRIHFQNAEDLTRILDTIENPI